MTVFKNSKDDVLSTSYDPQDGKIFYSLSNEGTLRLPSFTTAARNALTDMVAGDTIFNSTTLKINFYDGSAWRAVTSS